MPSWRACLFIRNAGGLLLSSPAVVSTSGKLDVFAVGVDNRIYQNNWDGTTWNGWSQVDCGGSFPEIERVVPPPEVPAPAVAALGGSQLDLFRRGPDNTLLWCHSDDGVNWRSQNLGGRHASATTINPHSPLASRCSGSSVRE